jgi:predicted O-methyltransferase YrrM
MQHRTQWPDGRLTPKNLTWKLLRHAMGVGDAACLRKLVSPGISVEQARIEHLLQEICSSQDLVDSLEDNGRLYSGLPASLSGQHRLLAHANLDGTGRGKALLLYVATRLTRPSVVVESGCFTGWDSAILLHALHKNGHGHLYTIDLAAKEGQFSQVGPNASLPSNLPIGFLVPPAFKDRWTLIVGDVREELDPLLRKLPEVGMFYHDSDHSYAHMTWELITVWSRLAPGGLAIADDISWSTAFWDFARKVHRRPAIHRKTPNVGALSK